MRQQRKKKRRVPITVPLASMGDIAFLLIIFFMVCSNFTKDNVPIDLPSSHDLEKLAEPPISVMIDAEGQIYFQGAKVPDAQAVEWGVAALLEKRNAGKTDVTPRDRAIKLKCDKAVDKSIFEPVIEAIANGGGVVEAEGLELQ